VDVQLFQTNEGGDVQVVSGDLLLTDGIESAAYLSLFGGDEDDDGTDATEPKQWWGNCDEPVAERAYRSELQAALKTVPLIAANLLRFEEAASRDLAWFTSTGVATFVAVRATMPSLGAVMITGAIEVDGARYPFKFKATPDDPKKPPTFGAGTAIAPPVDTSHILDGPSGPTITTESGDRITY